MNEPKDEEADGLGGGWVRSTDYAHLFTEPGDQLEKVAEWNRRYGWGFTVDDFKKAAKNIPEWPEAKSGQIIAVTLVPYQDDEEDVQGFQRTFHELYAKCANEEYDSRIYSIGDDKVLDGPEALQLRKGIKYTPGLRWEVIDLGSNLNRNPLDIRVTALLPHAGILASAVLHPEWIRAVAAGTVPPVWMPGYEMIRKGRKILHLAAFSSPKILLVQECPPESKPTPRVSSVPSLLQPKPVAR